MKKIVLAMLLALFLVAFSSLAAADWFGSSMSRGITGFAVVADTDPAVSVNTTTAVGGTTSADQIREALKKSREAVIARKKALADIKLKTRAKITQIRKDTKEDVNQIRGDDNKTRVEKREEIKGVRTEAKKEIRKTKVRKKISIEEAKQRRDSVKADVIAAAKRLRDARQMAREKAKMLRDTNASVGT